MSVVSSTGAVFVRRVAARTGDWRATDRGGVDWHARWIVIFLAVAVAVRLIRYLLRFPLWGDETLLAVNFLDRDYAGLMRPLDCHQVAPLLFLWIELTAVKLLGFHEWSLRLFPLLCSLAGIFLFHRLARRLLSGTALVLAVGIFAVTYSGIRYASEVKPYGVDLTVSTLILLLTVRWWQQPGETGQLWALTAVMPLALGLSFPSAFVAGGASLAIAAVLLGRRRAPGVSLGVTPGATARAPWANARGSPSVYLWAVWAVYNLVTAGSFLAWYWLGIRPQAQAELGVMAAGWSSAFPPRDSLVKLAVWLLQSHAGPLLAVPLGGDHWGSAGTLLLCLVAATVLLRQARYRLLLLCAAPFALNLLAAALGRYPYGGHMRLAMHVVPIVCILAGIGAAATIQWLDGLRNPLHKLHQEIAAPSPNWPIALVIGLLLLMAILTTARDFCLPGKEQQVIRKRDFASWFWSSLEREHEVACIASGLPPELPALDKPGRGTAAPPFLCDRRIYSPRSASGIACDLDRVSPQRPLACVQYWSHLAPYDPAVFARWLDVMKQRYDLVATTRYPLLQDNDNDREPEPADRIEVYEFALKDTLRNR